MVGIMSARSREEAANLLHSIKVFSTDVPSKLDSMHQLKEILLDRDSSLLSEFVPHLLELQSDRSAPVRKSLAQMIGEIGLTHTDFIPYMLPILISFFKDGTPAVARQAIISGTNLFRSTLEKVAVQGLHSSGLDSSLESSWDWMLKFKDTVYPIAFQPGADGIRVLAVKFVEAVILLYTPDPDGSSESQSLQECGAGQVSGFNVSWLRGGHPLLNVGDLSMEATQSLGLLLDQLRHPKVRALSNSVVVVLIKSLSAIAMQRPAFYGRILPVLLGLDPSIAVVKGIRVAGAHHTLKNAFLACLKCTNPGAAPWRDRLASALKEMKPGELAVQSLISSGSMEDRTGEAYLVKDEKPIINACDAAEVDKGRKRSPDQGIIELRQDNGVFGKRVKPIPSVSVQSDGGNQGGPPSVGATSTAGKGDPVHQLCAMFGTVVAQGDKGVGTLDLLIQSISADLLAEVVMANMKYLSPIRPKAEDEESAISSSSSIGDFSTLASDVASLFSGFPQMALLDAQSSSKPLDVSNQKLVMEPAMLVNETENDTVALHVNTSDITEAMTPTDVSPSEVIFPNGIDNDNSNIQLDIDDMETQECGIPGLDTINSDESPELLDGSYLASAGLPGLSQDQITNVDLQVSVSSGSVPADRSEEVSPKATVSEVNSASVSSSQFVLPKMSAPVVNLTDDQKDDLQRAVFMRIIENYKKVSVAGGSHLRLSLLACLGVDYPLELDPWKLLQKHILLDYLNHEGHELTIRILYRLFREAEQENDFFSSTTATSVYESFLLVVAETLRDSFPASDKSLSRLLGEVPYIPKSAFTLLESLCCPKSSDKTDKELQNGDRVTQGLSAVWSLILLRPPIRDVCLKIALQSAVHPMEEVRMKAIRLVANKLYPISSITQQIEDFATEMLLSVKKSHDMESTDVGEPTSEVQKDSDLEKPSNEQLSTTNASKDIPLDSGQSSSPPTTSSSPISDAQRRMSLYFALCTKKHSLFRQVFVIYDGIPNAVIQAVHRQIPILVRTMGSSSELLAIISDPPAGSESLLMQVLNILTDGTIPSPDLVSTVKRLYDSKLKDVEILIPVLPLLSKEEVSAVFPQLVNLPLNKFQATLSRLLQGSSHFGPALTPAEVLIAIHGIDPERDGIPLKKVTDACNACFEQRQIFTQQVLAKVLNQLVEQIPLPLLFMRTVLQAIGAFPALVDFIMEILSRLVTKQIWKYPKLWVGFLKCALLTKPQSFGVLLQLPAVQLENALNRTAALKPPLITHASQPNIRSSLPRSTLVVLGLAPESQTSSQAQSAPAKTVENSTSGAEGTGEKTKDSSTAS